MEIIVGVRLIEFLAWLIILNQGFMAWVIINKGLKRIIEDKSISSTITYERIIVDLHTGRLFGVVGITLIDIVTLGMLILAITGTISWMRHKKIF